MVQHSKNKKEISKTPWTGRMKMEDKDTSMENCQKYQMIDLVDLANIWSGGRVVLGRAFWSFNHI